MGMRASFTQALLLLAALAVACVTPRPDGGINVDATATDGGVRASTLGPGDVMEVNVYQERDLSGAYRLSAEGTVDFPLCGKVDLKGRTSSEAADALTVCLGKFIKSPSVSVLVREFTSQKVFVFGEVQRPGTFPFQDEMTIVQAITLAGGFSKTASRNDVQVTRVVDGVEQKIRVRFDDVGVGKEKNFSLRPGDIVFVPESFF